MSEQDPKSVFDAAAEEPEASAQQFSASVAVGEDAVHHLTDHSEEQQLVADHEREMGVNAPQKPDREFVPMQNPSIMHDPVQEMRETIEGSFKDTFSVGDIEVNHEERARFVRCALHDTAMWFDITLEGVGVKVNVVIPPESFTAMAANAVTAWGKADYLDVNSNIQWYLAFQQLHVWYQAREIDGEPTSWSEFFDTQKTTAELRRFVNDPANLESVIGMHSVKWRMLVEALRIAEAKYKLCLEAWRDRSFFTSAGIA